MAAGPAAPTRACCSRRRRTIAALSRCSPRPQSGLHQHRLGNLRLDQPAGPAVAAGRLRPQPRAAVRQAWRRARWRSRWPPRRRPRAVDRRRTTRRAAGRSHQRVRLRRLRVGGGVRAPGAAGRGGRNGRRPRRPGGHRAAAAEWRGQPVGAALPDRRSHGRSGLHPGDAGYEAAAAAPAYPTSAGGRRSAGRDTATTCRPRC